MKNIHPKCLSCSNGNFSWSDQTFCEISRLEFVSKRFVLNDFESKWPVSIPPYTLLTNQLLKKWILLCGLHHWLMVYSLRMDQIFSMYNVILTCILLFSLFRCCCISIIVLTIFRRLDLKRCCCSCWYVLPCGYLTFPIYGNTMLRYEQLDIHNIVLYAKIWFHGRKTFWILRLFNISAFDSTTSRDWSTWQELTA